MLNYMDYLAIISGAAVAFAVSIVRIVQKEQKRRGEKPKAAYATPYFISDKNKSAIKY